MKSDELKKLIDSSRENLTDETIRDVEELLSLQMELEKMERHAQSTPEGVTDEMLLVLDKHRDRAMEILMNRIKIEDSSEEIENDDEIVTFKVVIKREEEGVSVSGGFRKDIPPEIKKYTMSILTDIMHDEMCDCGKSIQEHAKDFLFNNIFKESDQQTKH